jgi:hypothetical protein
MDGARATCGYATTEFRSCNTNVFAQHPEQRGAGRDVNILRFAIEGESHHAEPPLPGFIWYLDAPGSRLILT